MARALVTGASGFIGRRLVAALRQRGWAVTAFVRPASDQAALRESGATLALGDITDIASLRAALPEHDIVFHLAAVVGKNPGGWEHHRDVGVQGVANLIDAMAATRVTRLIHMSSCAVYRAPAVGVPLTEEAPMNTSPAPWQHYARQKVITEQMVWRAHAAGTIRATTLRPSTVLGAGDPSLVGRMQALMISPLGAFANDLDHHFPVVVVDELVGGIVDAAAYDGAIGKAYNLSGREPVTKRQMLRWFREAGAAPAARRSSLQAGIEAVGRLSSALGAAQQRIGIAGPPLAFKPVVAYWERHAQRSADPDLLIDCTRARRDLGWLGAADYQQAIRAAVAWQCAQQER